MSKAPQLLLPGRFHTAESVTLRCAELGFAVTGKGFADRLADSLNQPVVFFLTPPPPPAPPGQGDA